MAWRDLETNERWKMVIAAVQAAATFGTFIVAAVGIWKVTPIITYQVERQQEAAPAPAGTSEYSEVANEFVDDVLRWWTVQVQGCQRIMELTGKQAGAGLDVNYEVVKSEVQNEPDYLVVTASHARGETEMVKVPVNAGAIPPSQYIQRKINHGAFSGLDSTRRQRVENAIARYMHKCMVPKVPPAYVSAGLSLREVHEQVALAQGQREEAVRHIRALRGIIDAALED